MLGCYGHAPTCYGISKKCAFQKLMCFSFSKGCEREEGINLTLLLLLLLCLKSKWPPKPSAEETLLW